jgi:hypothetical protein
LQVLQPARDLGAPIRRSIDLSDSIPLESHFKWPQNNYGERLAEGGEHPLVAFLGLCLGQQLYEVISHAGRDGIAVQFSNKRIGLSSGYEYN